MIELGIAYAMDKKIILISKRRISIKETVIGVADSIIEYEKLNDIVEPMSKLFSKWESERK